LLIHQFDEYEKGVNNTDTPVQIITYLLSSTGRDHATIKEGGAATFAWVMLNGFIGSQLLKQKSKLLSRLF